MKWLKIAAVLAAILLSVQGAAQQLPAYRLCWKESTGKTGCGASFPAEKQYDFRAINEIARSANSNYPGVFHWVEKVAQQAPAPGTSKQTRPAPEKKPDCYSPDGCNTCCRVGDSNLFGCTAVYCGKAEPQTPKIPAEPESQIQNDVPINLSYEGRWMLKRIAELEERLKKLESHSHADETALALPDSSGRTDCTINGERVPCSQWWRYLKKASGCYTEKTGQRWCDLDGHGDLVPMNCLPDDANRYTWVKGEKVACKNGKWVPFGTEKKP